MAAVACRFSTSFSGVEKRFGVVTTRGCGECDMASGRFSARLERGKAGFAVSVQNAVQIRHTPPGLVPSFATILNQARFATSRARPPSAVLINCLYPGRHRSCLGRQPWPAGSLPGFAGQVIE
jgi:hypothetical protein